MKRQDSSQKASINSIAHDKVEELKCSEKIGFLKAKLHEKASILDKGEHYLEISKGLVNSTLFFLFGQFQFLDENSEKAFKKQVNKKEQGDIQYLFKQFHSRPNITEQNFISGDFKDHLNRYLETIKANQSIVKIGAKPWDKYGPQILSQRFSQVYFNLDFSLNKYSSKNPKKNNKRMLITSFDENDDEVVLCFFETKNQFSKNFIDDIKLEAQKIQKAPSKQEEKQIPRSGPTQPKSQQKKPQSIKKNQISQPQGKKMTHNKTSQKGLENADDKNQEQEDEKLGNRKLGNRKPKTQDQIKQNGSSRLYQIFYLLFALLIILTFFHEYKYQTEILDEGFSEKIYKVNWLERGFYDLVKEGLKNLGPITDQFSELHSEYVKPLMDPVAETLDGVINHEIVINASETIRSNLKFGFDTLKSYVDEMIAESLEEPKGSIQEQL